MLYKHSKKKDMVVFRVVFLEKGARVMLTMNLLSVYWDTC